MSDDPWKHRSSGMRCKTCIWFVFKTVGNAVPKKTSELEDNRVSLVTDVGRYPVMPQA
jgi:hypothetical protein